ncbi:hypothetical protein BB561_000743 [Smittium simulii]|uniref:Uncharacterized protein n=1 Tax=Smittium simulii TaxID=133385 RepID=A0A2T9YXT2_9FUNG|nr:hypothetical protein BB561_000743 [Smittium simulii]
MFTRTNTVFCIVKSMSASPVILECKNGLNESDVAISDRTGVLKTIPVINILNIATLEPLIQHMNICIGSVFAGLVAMSHAFLLRKYLSLSSSSLYII